ncbi:PRTRC system protein E [Novosphingobium resinovorum]|uniref:PRTRC system protein E n=1 Tax=Novosphingobium resinovorum TaxID=158500 RepID=A0A1D8A2K1_9SPHN|nr:PRTRC system protein E [Novosphingobium resinovorum]AOR76302.1 PRTRC system protein E [Novosphingobium resinovorum]
MLITSLLPLLSRYSLGLDLAAGPDETVTLIIMPRKAEGVKNAPGAEEIRPISITATAAEIDAELALGEAGALGQLIASRKALGDQLAEQKQATEAAKAKVKPATTKAATTPAKPEPAATPAPVPDPKPGEPASLW